MASSSTSDYQRPCRLSSASMTSAFAFSVVSAVAFGIAMATQNWAASGTLVKSGLFEYCILIREKNLWNCYPISEDFSVATQAFSILSCTCFTCLGVLYFVYVVFRPLQDSRPMLMCICLVTFTIVTLQFMNLVVYAAKFGDFHITKRTDYFSLSVHHPAFNLSWSYYAATSSTIMATVSGVLTYLRLKTLTYEYVFGEETSENII